MGEGECDVVEASKKGRHRKKQLYNSILQQMEFYFSDSNLSKDRYLSKIITENPYVDIKIFLSFNKIRKLNCTLEDICKAVSKSELIEISEDKEKICRKKPLKVKENVDECTIYIENIKPDANHEWLKHVFSDFGSVVYVSIPKYKQNKDNKGFAFVEFETENEAQNALAYFDSIGCKMPSDTNPDQLKSIMTFEDGTSNKFKIAIGTVPIDNSNQSDNPKKRKLSDQQDEQGKRIKIEVGNDSQKNKEECVGTDCMDDKKKSTKQDRKTKIEGSLEQDSSKTENLEPSDADYKRKKKHKKDKKKSYFKELGLQILSKKEWKKMRNRYLDLQKKKMKEFKGYLQKQRFSHKYEMSGKGKDDNGAGVEQSNKEEIPEKLEFVPGVIVKLNLPEPCMDVKKLKSDIKAVSPDVKYVDIPISTGGEEVYVRFSNAEGAKEFCHQEFVGERAVLENEEEKLYWEKIQNDRTVKFTKSAKKQRGRDRLLKKAEKERAKHIRFDEVD